MQIDRLEARIHAGWMGKNIGGTLGGPLEGRMELLDVTGYTQSFVEAVENDDLDLQLVNLHAVEQYGGQVDAVLLGQEWLSHVHFQYDEYGHALTNLRQGLIPPLAGAYNNFFTDCMGAPIRSELWAMLCPGQPDLAAHYAYQDAMVDHAGGEGMYGEVFFAALESLAFVGGDARDLINRALGYLPERSRVRQAVSLLLACHDRGDPWQMARERILERFGGENFTYAPINVAFTLVGLLYERGFTAQMLATVNCGYDTDCTVATLGALLGILHGPDYLDRQWTEPLGERILVSAPITGFDPPATIGELTHRTLAARERLTPPARLTVPGQADWALQTRYLPAGSRDRWDLAVTLAYGEDHPVALPGGEKTVRVTLTNGQSCAQGLRVSLSPPPGFGVSAPAALTLAPGARGEAAFTLRAPAVLPARLPCFLTVERLAGETVWDAQTLPVPLLPPFSWRVDGERVHSATNRLTLSGPATLATTLWAPTDREALLIAVHAGPVVAELDGRPVIASDEATPVIPAYHRADRRKSARVALAAGSHTLTLRTERGGELYVYLVDPKRQYACYTDVRFG